MGENQDGTTTNNENATTNETKKSQSSKLLTILVALVMTVYGFYTMIVAIIAYADYQDLAVDFDYILAEYKTSPVVNVYYVTGQTDCTQYDDDQYEGVSLFNYTWAGTKAGCDCIAIDPDDAELYNVEQKLYTGSCASLGSNYTSAGANCAEVQAVDAINMKLISDDSSNDVLYCARRLKDYPFYKKAGRKTGSCEGNDKKCDFGTDGDYYCVPSDSPCPVVGIETSASAVTGYTVTNDTAHTIAGTASLRLYTSTASSLDLYPINLLLIGERSSICRQYNRRRPVEGSTEYVLMNDSPISDSDCDEDNRFSATDFKNTESTFFTTNGLYESDYVDFTFSTTDYYTLFTRNYLKWDIEAREDLKKLIDIEQRIRSMNTYQLLIMLFSILSCLMVSVILTFSELYNLCGKDVPCIDGEGDEEKERIKKYKKICGYCGKLFQFPFAILAFVISNGIKGLLKRIADQQPGDDITNATLTNMSNQVETKVWKANLQIIIGLFIVIIIDIIMYIKERRDRAKKGDKVTTEPAKDIEMKNQNQQQPNFTSNNATFNQPQQQVIVVQQPQQQSYFQPQQQQQQVIQIGLPQQQAYFQPQQQQVIQVGMPQQQTFFQPQPQQQQQQQQYGVVYQQPVYQVSQDQNYQNDTSKYGLVQ